MRTIGEVDKGIARFKKLSKAAKWIRRNLNYRLGSALQDVIYDKWDNYLSR